MEKKEVSQFYDAASINYEQQYKRDNLENTNISYPANYFRLQLLLNSFVNNGIKKVVEVGVGEGTPLVTLAKAGIEVAGFDISEEMVKKSKKFLEKNGLPSQKIIWGDIEDSLTYASLMNEGQYDGLIAMGVMPHVINDIKVLRNMKSLIKPGGKVFIEFRNKLFSLFSFNKLTYDFIMDDLLDNVSPEIKETVSIDLKKRLEMNQPTPRLVSDHNLNAPGYDAILSKFHNPFEVKDLFKSEGFCDVQIMWYHYHPAPPFLENKNVQSYREESIKLEQENSGWKGYFLCSAFVIEATKIGN
jgi:2-polyprenyl-3-methyl-5-hydroxy-6-metoxy-1,4-benzoquinol methylase